MQAETERQYFPENWKPLERWLSTLLCRRIFSWMWHEHGYECYRARDSGELLYLDALGQCWDVTEVGAIPADFAQHFERCAGQAYLDDYTEARQHLIDLEQAEDDEDDEDDDEDYLPAVHPLNGESLGRIVQHWALVHKVDSVKLERLLSELTGYTNELITELGEQCRTLLKTTRCWLK
ncbi:MAG: hypothetical protein JO227_21185 [Acetobacteraceae bacterium]|nr:hypothetical protein [Acetobacteraceae bacterium]